uniref:Uncharacterized protein n=1 Tax=Trichogramma kaykai TaxID=54128 RepID=A0ABD2W8Z3_9HYME
MLSDSDKSIRRNAVSTILNIRKEKSTSQTVFEVPPINFDAKHYSNLINWENSTESPLTKDLSNDELLRFVETHDSEAPIFLYPCHSQAVERGVKTVRETSLSVSSEDSHQALVRNKIEARLASNNPSSKSQLRVSSCIGDLVHQVDGKWFSPFHSRIRTFEAIHKFWV